MRSTPSSTCASGISCRAAFMRRRLTGPNSHMHRSRRRGDFGTSARLLPGRLATRLLDDELVLDTKRSRHLTRAQAGNGLVALGVHHAEQCDLPVFDDDVERVVAERLHAGEPTEVHAVKAGAERMAVAPQQASARRVP